MEDSVKFSDIQASPRSITAFVHITPHSTWIPNTFEDNIKLVRQNITEASTLLSPPLLTYVKDGLLCVQFEALLSRNVDYKLVYMDKDGVKRGTSSSFVLEGSLHDQSFDSFETVSDADDQSFTVINMDNTSISKGWELPTAADAQSGCSGSGSSNSGGSSEEESSKISRLSPPVKTSDIVTFERPHKEIVSSTSGNGHTKVFQYEDDPIVPASSDSVLIQSATATTTTAGWTNVIGDSVTSETGSSTDVTRSVIDNDHDDIVDMMSKSVIVEGAEQLSLSEIKSLQTRNRAHVKKIHRLSELLDNQTQATKEKTEENKMLHKKVLQATAEKEKLQKLVNQKDSVIESLQELIKTLKTTLKPQDTNEQGTVIDRSDEGKNSLHIRVNDVGIDRPTISSAKTTGTSHHHAEHKRHQSNSERKKHYYKHRYQDDRSSKSDRLSPKRTVVQQNPAALQLSGEHSRTRERVRHRGDSSSSAAVTCPICDLPFPPSLSEEQKTLHVESCLRKHHKQ